MARHKKRANYREVTRAFADLAAARTEVNALEVYEPTTVQHAAAMAVEAAVSCAIENRSTVSRRAQERILTSQADNVTRKAELEERWHFLSAIASGVTLAGDASGLQSA